MKDLLKIKDCEHDFWQMQGFKETCSKCGVNKDELDQINALNELNERKVCEHCGHVCPSHLRVFFDANGYAYQPISGSDHHELVKKWYEAMESGSEAEKRAEKAESECSFAKQQQSRLVDSANEILDKHRQAETQLSAQLHGLNIQSEEILRLNDQVKRLKDVLMHIARCKPAVGFDGCFQQSMQLSEIIAIAQKAIKEEFK